MPLFLDQLVDALRLRLKSNTTIGRSAVQHGQALLLQGSTVHEYGNVCQAITEADETHVGGIARNMHASKRERLNGKRGRSVAGKTVVMGLLARHGKDGTSASR